MGASLLALAKSIYEEWRHLLEWERLIDKGRLLTKTHYKGGAYWKARR